MTAVYDVGTVTSQKKEKKAFGLLVEFQTKPLLVSAWGLPVWCCFLPLWADVSLCVFMHIRLTAKLDVGVSVSGALCLFYS